MVGLMAGTAREQALSLLASAKNHPDLAVKISSLKQAKEILISAETSLVSQSVPHIQELQSSPESLVRKFLVELVEELALKAAEQSSALLSVLLSFLKDDAPAVVRQSIISGTNIFCRVLEEIALQYQQSGKVEGWLEESWLRMVNFKDVVYSIASEPGSVGTKSLAMKFIEILVLLTTPETNGSEASTSFQMKEEKVRNFNVSWIAGGNPILDSAMLTLEANKGVGLLLEQLQSASLLRGSLIIVLINCLAAIARRRPMHYDHILSALVGFDPDFETQRGGHTASIQYSLRTAFIGFLRCTHAVILASRDRLLVALRAMNAGEVADQVIRQVDKIIKISERALRDNRVIKEDPPTGQAPLSSGDFNKKRSMVQDNGGPVKTDDVSGKKARNNSDSSQDDGVVNGFSSKLSLLDSDLTPVEQMIAMIGALLAEGERGAESLEVLISQIHPDLLADIVIANMKHLPKSPPPVTSWLGQLPSLDTCSTSSSSQVMPPTTVTVSPRASDSSSQVSSPLPSGAEASMSTSDISPTLNLPVDFRRDPRRDPRRLDPRRVTTPVDVQSSFSKAEDTSGLQPSSDASSSLSKPQTPPASARVETSAETLMYTIEMGLPESSMDPSSNSITKEILEFPEEAQEMEPVMEEDAPSDLALSPVRVVDDDPPESTTLEYKTGEIVDSSYAQESNLHPSALSSTPISEETSDDLPLLPLYVELTNEQQQTLRKSAVARIIEAYRQIRTAGCNHARLLLLARLVAQNDANDDIVAMMQKHIITDYQHQKGHELAMHALYHLHTVMLSEPEGHSCSPAAGIYEKFLLAVAKALRDSLPASDKSFSRILGEAPLLPPSALKLIEDLCYSQAIDHSGKDLCNGDRVTQGLGAVWSLILGRPLDRNVCLSIALKCSVHRQDDVRAKAIRLVANKLYLLAYISEDIEKFATTMLLSVVDMKHVPDVELVHSGPNEHRTEANVGNQEPSVSGSQSSEPGATESDSKVVLKSEDVPALSLSQALRCMSLFFAICTKKPSLLKLVFEVYGRAPQAVKQAARRLIPKLVQTIGSSYSELLIIIADPPEGSENLLMLLLKILTEEMAPSAELIATIKHLYETKLKDAVVLIPVLSSLSKDEVLPIFPRLIDLPLDKFQTALARILQGSAHTGPALTPAEVFVAIHAIDPEKDGIRLKKITEACSACFEQRTVFTQQVLAKALNQLVEQTPLPLLLMRTVIQAIDAFPKLVDFVMGILSRLVSKQIWRMPMLWVGFLKCASQTRPHSFHVLLQLPPAQLENALNKHPNIRGPLAEHANQASVRATLPRATLVVLGLVKESQASAPAPMQSALHAPDTSSSVQSATLT